MLIGLRREKDYDSSEDGDGATSQDWPSGINAAGSWFCLNLHGAAHGRYATVRERTGSTKISVEGVHLTMA